MAKLSHLLCQGQDYSEKDTISVIEHALAQKEIYIQRWAPQFWCLNLKDSSAPRLDLLDWVDDVTIFSTQPPAVCSPRQVLRVGSLGRLPYCDPSRWITTRTLLFSDVWYSRDAVLRSVHIIVLSRFYPLKNVLLVSSSLSWSNLCFPLITWGSHARCFSTVSLSF